MSCCPNPVAKGARGTYPAQPAAPHSRLDGRFMPLALIILLHVGLLAGLSAGLPKPTAQAIPAEVFATFIQAESPPEPNPPRPAAALPKAMPATQLPLARPRPTTDATPLQQMAAAPMPAEPAPAIAAPAVASSAAPVIQPAPRSPPVPAAPKTITSGVEYLRPPRPEYPPLARRMGEEGRVVLRALVNDQGHPERVEVHTPSGIERLDEAGKQAVLRALFRPHVENDQAVAVYVIVPINFQLRN